MNKKMRLWGSHLSRGCRGWTYRPAEKKIKWLLPQSAKTEPMEMLQFWCMGVLMQQFTDWR